MVAAKFVRRLTAVATAAVLAGSVLSACASSGAVDSGKHSIDITVHPVLVDQFKQYAQAFEKSHKGYTVTVKAAPADTAAYLQQLVSQNLSNALPDILINYDGFDSQLADKHITYDMTSWLKEGKNGLTEKGFQSSFLDIYNNGGAITGLPVSADSGILFYNKDLFAKYGVEPPKAGWTYDDMYAAAQQIHEKSGGSVYGIRPTLLDSSLAFTFEPVLRAEGSYLYDPKSNKFSFADAAGLKAWKLLLQPYLEKWGEPYSANMVTQNGFASGQDAMDIEARPNVAAYRTSLTFKWDVAPLPTVNGKSTTGGGAYGLSITQKSKDKEADWAFLSWYFSTKGGMALAQKNGVVPTTKDGLANGSWKQDSNPVPANLVATTDYAVKNAVLPVAVPASASADVTPALQKALQEVLLNGTSVEVAYKAAQDQLNEALKK